MTHTIVIPLYNKADYVAESLESLAVQTKLPDELIIVDDASTDHSLAVAKKFLADNATRLGACKVTIIELAENRGPGNARNTGLQHATGILISFLDADDLYEPQLLQTAATIFQQQQVDFMVLNLALVPGEEIYPEVNGLKKYLRPMGDNLYKIHCPLRAVSSPHFVMGVGSNVIVRREWIGDTIYTTRSLLNEGIDFWYRVLKRVPVNGNVVLLTGEHLKVRIVSGSLSRKTYSNFREPDIPPVITRYLHSKDVNEKLLMMMIGERWYVHVLQTLPSRTQQLRFVLHYAYLLPTYMYCLLLRISSNLKKVK